VEFGRWMPTHQWSVLQSYGIDLKVEAVSSYEVLVTIYQTLRYHGPAVHNMNFNVNLIIIIN
jgi:hypothetical protein